MGGKKISCTNSGEFPVSLLYICYVGSSLEKCFDKFTTEGCLKNMTFFFLSNITESTKCLLVRILLLSFRRAVMQACILV